MIIKINEIETNFSGRTLFELLKEKGIEKNTGIAAAVNESVIKKEEWETFRLNPNDSVIVITPAQGG